MSVGKGFGDNFLGMNQLPGAFRKQQQDLSPGGRKPTNTGYGLGKQGYKMGMYKDDSETEDDFNNPLLNKPSFSQRPSDRDLNQQMSQLSMYSNPPDSRAGTWNGSGQTFEDPRTVSWNGQSIDDSTGDLWSRGTTSHAGGGMPPLYNSGQVIQTSRGQSSTTPFSRSFSTPPGGSANDRFNALSGNGMPPISTGFQHSSSPSPGQTSPGRSGLLSVGGRGPVGQQLPSSLSSQNPSAINNVLSKAIRPSGLPSALNSASRSSPNLLPLGLAQPQQQTTSQIQNAAQQQQPHRAGSFGSLSSLAANGPFPNLGSRSFSSSGSQVSLLGQLHNVSAGQSVSLQSTIASAFGGSSDNLNQPIGSGISNFDLDFPALANRGTPSSSSPSSSHSSSVPSRTGYGGALQSHDLESFVMVANKNQDSGSEFQIQNEDFPALPGTSQSESSLQQESKSLVYHDLLMSSGSSYESVVKDGRPFNDKKPRTTGSAGIQTSSSGVITNIPVGMVTDQFGMIGLLTFIRAAETEPNLVTLALGRDLRSMYADSSGLDSSKSPKKNEEHLTSNKLLFIHFSDLTTLGLNLNSTESLYHTFGSPFSDTTCRPHEIDYYVPPEYLVNSSIRDRLADIRLSRYSDDLLFYLYYTNCGDLLQLAAAAELFHRDWRYHKEERVWITRAPGMDPQVKTSSYERGMYYCFDYQNWRKVPKEFHVEYDKLEEKPSVV